ncbi:interferon-induced very large GTPase 1-like [Mytilus edulis]|uniref:interferon-induced very large GTPase 1-like n=1 Tax=Mytilus edulis TaxID=6550 RepID=UPI0039EF1E96
MARKQQNENLQEDKFDYMDLSDTFIADIEDPGNSEKAIIKPPSVNKNVIMPWPDVNSHSLDRNNLLEEQHKDPEVLQLSQRAQPQEEADKEIQETQQTVYSSTVDTIPTDRKQGYQESSMEVKCSDKRHLPSVENEQRIRKDCFSAEQLNAPVKKTFSVENNKSEDTDEKLPDLNLFIDSLGLLEYYPDKMQVREVMKVELSVKDVTFKEIAFNFVRNIIMINLNGRDRFVQEQLRQKYKPKTGQTNSTESYIHTLRAKSKNTNREINPLDLTIAIFKCASPMLKHTLACKFFACQLAIPFAFPKFADEEIPILSSLLHAIVIECTSEGKPINKVSVDCPCHVVSFCRFGHLSVSKSKLMNEILNDHYHNTFLDKDCPLGSSNRYISDGLIEAAWYLPSSKSSVLSSVTTFLNLRGDANRYQEQLRILSRISSILVIVIDLSKLDENFTTNFLQPLLQNVQRIIIAIDACRNTENELIQKFETLSNWASKYNERVIFCVLKVDEKMRSSADIKKEMRDIIRNMLDTRPLSPISSRIKASNLNTNEHIGFYRDVQQTVNDLWELFPESCENVKQQVTPVQGEHWTAWSTLNKTFQNSTLFKSQNKADQIKIKMIAERMKQVALCQTIEPFMAKFIDCCWQFSEIENECQVFVMLVKQLLDDSSRKVLPQFQSQYVLDWECLKDAKEHKKENAEIKKLLKRVAQSEKKLSEASFGFEHLCREMGQIFEALSECETVSKDLQKYVDILPKIAARLLLIGQPFELMDGDVANVPIIWINAVFLELKQSLNNKKLLALSVLGIQSSGKSTLLNTMFGFQFAVSAGRCTRGVYAQLMPVENTAFPFDYILVIDTEGLRALELADLKKSHDNELATFVVGLGDMTIVNIKGENTSEVKDVLQIVVHAFLRLKLANKRKSSLKQRCIFAHQNVPAQDANEKMRHGRQKFIEILDKMTKEAAFQEGISDIQTFNQVIQLDIDKDIWYFSDLWRGDPPMAPANPGYSETVTNALKAITKRLIFDRETYLTITDTVTRICDLWTGILKDDFVFSFRNCLEFKAFNDMERHYHSWAWGLEQKVQEFIKADAKSTLMTCDHPDEFDNNIQNIFIKLSKMVNEDLDEGTKELDSFIENSCLKDVMIQWQQSKHSKFKYFGDELIEQAKIDIRNMKTELKVQKKRLTDKTKHEFEINRQAEEIAVQMKGNRLNKATASTIQQAFDRMWNGWISQFDTKAFQHVSSIKEQIELLIHNRFSADVAYLREVDEAPFLDDIPFNSMKQLEYHFVVPYIKEEHFSIHSKYFGKGTEIPIVQCKVQIIEVVNVICRKIDSRLSELQVQDIKFSTAYVSEIFNIICDAFDKHNEHKQNGFHFNLTAAFRACICTYVKRYLVVFFEKLDEKYSGKHSPKAVMEEYKGTVRKLFENTVGSKTEDVIAVDLFRDAIIKEMDKYISGMMSIDVQSYILGMYPSRKLRLIKDILTKLAENEEFSGIKSYIQDPLVFSTNWINDVTNTTMFENKEDGYTVYANLAKSRIQKLFPKIAEAISNSYHKCEQNNCKTVSQWIDYFVENINQNKIPISKDTMAHVKSRKVSDLCSFVEMLNKQLGDIKKEMSTIFENQTKGRVSWDENPVPKIMLKLWGCSETCMFCNEPCIQTNKDHIELGKDHECLQHRPQGIGGFHWNDTSKLCVEFCNHWVGTDQTYIWNRGIEIEETRKYKEYKKHFPNWDIPHNLDKCEYWMWILCKYKDNLRKLYCTKSPDIPESWPLISKAKALESLSVYSIG